MVLAATEKRLAQALDTLAEVREELKHVKALRDAADAEIVLLEIECDQCARERDAYKAECDALAARVAALEAALGPAWAIAGYANDGPWGNGGPYSQDVWGVDDRYICTTSDADDANLIVAAVNAVRAAREVK